MDLDDAGVERTLFSGQWWLPATPEIRSAGALLATDQGLELQLHDALFAAGWNDMRQHPAIYGDVRPQADSGSGFDGPITLFDAFDTRVRPGRVTHAAQRVFAHTAVYGAHCASMDACMVSGIAMESAALDAWVPYSHYYREILDLARGGSLAHGEPKSIRFSVPGATGGLNLSHERSTDHARRSFALKEHVTASWGLAPHLNAAQAVEQFVKPLQDLLTICYAGPAPMRKLTATGAEGGLLGRSLTFYFGQVESGARSEKRKHDKKYLYPAMRVSDDAVAAGHLIERWYAAVSQGETRRGVRVLAGTLGHPRLYVENRLLGVVAALEAVHRAQYRDYDPAQRGHGARARRACDAAPADLRLWLGAMLRVKPRYTLRERLTTLLRQNADVLRNDWFGDEDTFTRAVSGARDAIAHGLEYTSATVQRTSGMLPIVYQVLVLLTAELLRQIEPDVTTRRSWLAGSEAARNCAHFLAQR